MTGKEQGCADDRTREGIARRSADSRQLDDMIREEIAKLVAETGQFNLLRHILVPMLAGAALVAATGAIVKLFL